MACRRRPAAATSSRRTTDCKTSTCSTPSISWTGNRGCCSTRTSFRPTARWRSVVLLSPKTESCWPMGWRLRARIGRNGTSAMWRRPAICRTCLSGSSSPAHPGHPTAKASITAGTLNPRGAMRWPQSTRIIRFTTTASEHLRPMINLRSLVLRNKRSGRSAAR